MTNTKKQSRKGRSPAGDTAKQIVSLTIDPALVAEIDKYAAEKTISRSKAVEAAIVCLTAPIASIPAEVDPVNALVSPDDCMFAAPSLGHAIFY